MNETVTQNDTRTMVEDNHFRVIEKLIKQRFLYTTYALRIFYVRNVLTRFHAVIEKYV